MYTMRFSIDSRGVLGYSRYDWDETNIVIPDGVIEIYQEAFPWNNRPKFTSVTIPESVKKIWPKAFCHCAYLREVVFHGYVTDFYRPFLQCGNLHSLVFPGDVRFIDYRKPIGYEVCDLLGWWLKYYIGDFSMLLFHWEDRKPQVKTVISHLYLRRPELFTQQDADLMLPYIQKKKAECIKDALEFDDIPLLKGILQLKLLDQSALDDYIRYAAENSKTEALAILIEYGGQACSKSGTSADLYQK